MTKKNPLSDAERALVKKLTHSQLVDLVVQKINSHKSITFQDVQALHPEVNKEPEKTEEKKPELHKNMSDTSLNALMEDFKEFDKNGDG